MEAGAAELIADALVVGTDLLDTWRTERLTIGGQTRTVHSLTINVQTYPVGVGGAFNQTWPTAIDAWSVIPNDAAANPVEMSQGRPLVWDEWQQIRVKSFTGAYPTRMYYDRAFSAGLGACLFYPIPDNAAVDVVLYQAVPAILSLVAATSYDLRPGAHRALKLNLALELTDRYGKEATDRLERRAARAKGDLKRANYIPRTAPIRPEWLIGGRRRSSNIYTDA
jgi:hypothetical protein